jgi:hypothetical protein
MTWRHNNGMHPTRDTLLVIYNRRLGRAGDARVRSPEGSGQMAQQAPAGALRRSNKRMHATADTQVVIRF